MLQYDINREAAKISALSSGKIDKYEYLAGEEILPSDQSRIIEQNNFTYSPLEKAFEKQIETIEDQGRKQVEVLEILKPEENQQNLKSIKEIFPKEMKTNEINNELNEIKKIEDAILRNDLIYKTSKRTFNFQTF